MVSTPEMPLAARRYLEELELCLKQKVGVSPEEALSDAREYLLSASDELQRSGARLSDEKLLDHFRQTFGEPAEVAEKYGAAAASSLNPRLLGPPTGYAPGWRICCTSCGRSAPLAAVGGIRVGASSAHKYTIGWCRECGWFRWLRIIYDLDSTNLTDHMGMAATPAQSLRSLHKPILTVLAIVFGTLGILALAFSLAGLFKPAPAQGQDATQSFDSQGQPLEGVGIEPEINVETTPADFQRSDAVLAQALKILRSK